MWGEAEGWRENWMVWLLVPDRIKMKGMKCSSIRPGAE